MSRPSIFITGAAAGIGQATARLFAAKGGMWVYLMSMKRRTTLTPRTWRK